MRKANIWSIKTLALLLAALTILAFAPLAAAQVVVDIGAVSDNESGTGWSTCNNFLTIHDGADIVITGTTNDRRVLVEENATVNITLDGVRVGIAKGAPRNLKALEIRTGADVTLVLSGANTLEGISAPAWYTADVTLVINGSGHLEAPGGISIHGINSDLTIDGGTITASGNIGISVSGGNLTINRGKVTATGSDGHHQLGIFVLSGAITINGGIVTASGSIGISVSGGNLTINGGTVTARGRSADILVRRTPRLLRTIVNF